MAFRLSQRPNNSKGPKAHHFYSIVGEFGWECKNNVIIKLNIKI